jgi:hypothetical protein
VSAFKDRVHQQNQASTDSVRQAGAEADEQAKSLLERALDVQAGQVAALEASPIDTQYRAALAVYVKAKHDQVERLEGKLEYLIEAQASRLQQVQGQQPGMLALPGTRAKWQQQLLWQQITVKRLHDRLESVREIKEAMGTDTPRIVELAARKLRAHDPGLASEWDEMTEAQRRHEALLRKREQEKKLMHERELREPLGRGLRLGLFADPRQWSRSTLVLLGNVMTANVQTWRAK